MNAKAISVKSKWPHQALDGKTVTFRIRIDHDGRPEPKEGKGKFRAHPTHDGLIRIEIVVTEKRSPTEMVDHILFCPQHAADHIEQNENASDSDFRLFEF